MARATVFESAQLGKETTSGTAVSANLYIASLGIGDPDPQGKFTPFRPSGSKFNTVMRKGKEHSILPWTMALDYNGIVYVQESLFGATTPSQPDASGAPSVYRWVHKPSTGADTPVTYTVERGSSSRAARFVYALFNSLSFSVESNKEDSEVSGNMLAQKIEDGISMTSSPTTVAAVPILPEHWAIYIADTQTALDSATALDNVLKVDFSYGDKNSPVFYVQRNTTFAGTAEKYADIGGLLSVEANAAGMAYLSNVRDMDEKWIRLEAEGNTIEGSYKYTWQIDIPIWFSSLPGFGDSGDVYAANFAFVARKDSTLGSALQITTTNTISSI